MSQVGLEDKLRKVVEKIFEAGYQVDGEAFKLLRSILEIAKPEKVVNLILEKIRGVPDRVFVSKEIIEKVFVELKSPERLEYQLHAEEKVEVGKGVWHPYAKEIEERVEVIKDPTKFLASTGNIENFQEYFKDRFRRLLRILSQRMDIRGYLTVSSVLRERNGTRVKVVGMVSEKVSRGKRIFITLEDFEDTITVLIQPDRLELIEKAQEVFLDQVICVVGFKSGNSLIVAEDLLFPDIPYHKPSYSKDPVNVVLTSDFHVGSKVFEEKLVEKFLAWLKGKIGGEKEREIAGRVKYLVVAGDLVDGVGLYPQQEEELEIKDIYKQYRVAAKIFEQIPDYIRIIIVPGNHDASRKILPQPAIQKKFAEPIYKISNITMLGNPAQVKLHGVNILIHHGRSLEDVLVALPHVNHHNVTHAMISLLKTRHLAPIYGGKTPIAPEPKDWMIVEQVPDIYHSGHIHVFDYLTYRGVWVINSGCWQRQTSYQKKMGITPIYGVIPVINLQTLNLTPIDFKTFT